MLADDQRKNSGVGATVMLPLSGIETIGLRDRNVWSSSSCPRAVEISVPGFKKWVRNDVVLQVNQRARVDIALDSEALDQLDGRPRTLRKRVRTAAMDRQNHTHVPNSSEQPPQTNACLGIALRHAREASPRLAYTSLAHQN